MEERIEDFLLAMDFLPSTIGDRDGQLAISQCLDLETTRAWLYREINARFDMLEKEENKENDREIEITKKTTLQPNVEFEAIEEL